ncbi:MAG: EamA/RhaT family transporter [Bacilli bacterium]|nr:EamA/RhaT family transporter [Bacilli bacterium]
MNVKALLAVTVTLLFWSSAFAGIRQALDGGYSPGHVVLIRFLSASAVFAVYALITRMKLPELRDLPRILMLSLVGVTLYHTTLTYGELSVPAGITSLIIASAPTFTALIAAIYLKDRLSAKGWLGIVIGFLGIALISFGSGHSHSFTIGALIILFSALCSAVFFVLQKPLFAKYSPIDLTIYFTWLGTLPMLVFSPGLFTQLVHAPSAATWSAIYIGVFPAAIANVAWAIALSAARTSIVSTALYINPVLAVFIAWIWLGEVPHPFALVGGAITITGVVIVNLWGTAKQRVRITSTNQDSKLLHK